MNYRRQGPHSHGRQTCIAYLPDYQLHSAEKDKTSVGKRVAGSAPGTLVNRSLRRTDFLIGLDQIENPRFSKAVSIIAFCGFVLLVTVTLSLWSHSAVTWPDAEGFQVPNLLNRF